MLFEYYRRSFLVCLGICGVLGGVEGVGRGRRRKRVWDKWRGCLGSVSRFGWEVRCFMRL